MVKTHEANIWENSRADQRKSEMQSWVFTNLKKKKLIFSKTLLRFSPGYELGTKFTYVHIVLFLS